MAKKDVPALSEQLSVERRRVDFDSYDISIQQLNSMVAKRQIDVAPAYQRQFRWDAERQSQFVESIFLGIPTPSLFMATNANGTWEVVDGVQRLNTIVHYAGNAEAKTALSHSTALSLAGLTKLTEMNGKNFSELPESVQLQFNLRPVKVTTLSDKSDLQVRFDLFERLNTGGVKLTDQEIRGCIFRGQFNDFLEDLAKDAEFNRVVLFKESMRTDGTREEFVLRFFAYFHNYKRFDHSVVGFLNDFMAESTRKFSYKENAKLFHVTFKALAKQFPQGIRRRSRVTPANLFEGVSVGAAIAISKKGRLKAGASKWVDSEEMRRFTTGATNSRTMVANRIGYAAQMFGS